MLPHDTLTAMVVSARLFGVLIALPISEALHSIPKLLIALCFGLALAPHVFLTTDISWYALPSECLIGFLLATPVRILAESFEMVGEWLDTARGQTIASVMDPLHGQQGSDMATIFRFASVALVTYIGGFEQIVATVQTSYSFAPLHAPFDTHELLPTLTRGGLSLLAAVCSLTSVWLLVYLLTDIFAALLAKVSHGLCFSSLSTIIKMLCTCALLANLVAHPKGVLTLVHRSICTSAAYAPSLLYGLDRIGCQP